MSADRLRVWARAALVAVSVSAGFACGNSPTAPTIPATTADLAGRITVIVPNGNYAGQIKVEADPTSATNGAKANVTVSTATVILRLNRSEGDFREFAPGQWVRVWFNGAVALSYPVQGTAGTIVIDSAGVGVTK